MIYQTTRLGNGSASAALKSPAGRQGALAGQADGRAGAFAGEEPERGFDPREQSVRLVARMHLAPVKKKLLPARLRVFAVFATGRRELLCLGQNPGELFGGAYVRLRESDSADERPTRLAVERWSGKPTRGQWVEDAGLDRLAPIPRRWRRRS